VAKEYLEQMLKINPTEYEVAALLALFFPNKTESTKIGDILGEEGIKLFKGTFKNNNKKSRKAFFKNDFIKKIWPVIKENMTIDDCFQGGQPNEKIYSTYSKCEQELQEYLLELPEWWGETFSL
jgi:hypothetical protein